MGHSEKREKRRRDGSKRPWEHVEGLLWNAGAWAVMSFGMGMGGAPRLWWGLAVGMHALGVAATLLGWTGDRAGTAAASGTAAAEPARQAGPAVEADPFLAEVDAAVAALRAAAGGKALPSGVDLAALRAAAAELRGRHLALDAQADGTARERLAAERDDALRAAERAADPRTAEVLRGQATSVSGRLAALEEAAGAASRLAARERTLLHQLEAVRLSLLQAGLDEARAPDLAGEVERLRLDLRAEAELESDLARARLGARAAQRT